MASWQNFITGDVAEYPLFSNSKNTLTLRTRGLVVLNFNSLNKAQIPDLYHFLVLKIWTKVPNHKPNLGLAL